MKNDIISIIVPVYNGENYIERCLDSLINQTYIHIEIIAVDDGSRDNSLNILRKYEEKYSNIKIISKKNGGVSSARNMGLKSAIGKYVAFVDADDYCEKEMYKNMINLAIKSDYDMICSGYYIDSYDGKKISEIKSERIILGHDEREKSEILHKACISYCVGKLFKREIIENNNIKFNEKLSMGEDALFTCEYLCNINTIALINKAYYHYIRANSQSLSTKYVNNIDVFIDSVWEKLDYLYEKYPHFKKLEHSDGSSREINISKMHLYNNYRKGCTLNASQRRSEIRKYMNNRKIITQMKTYFPKSNKDRLYKFLFKIKSPFIMDLIYSYRILFNNIISIFNGIKK